MRNIDRSRSTFADEPLQSQPRPAAHSAGTVELIVRTGSTPIDVPESFSPLVVVVVDDPAASSGSAPPPRDRAWREVHLPPSGQCGADIKRGFHESLRGGARSVAVWPGPLGPWQAGVSGLLRPLFTRHADLVLTGYSPDAANTGLRPLSARWVRRLLGARRRFAAYGPLAITRRALDMVPFEANDDGQLFYLHLLAQARHFGLEVAPCFLPPSHYEVLRKLPGSTPPAPLAQVSCVVELLAHRRGVADSPRFQVPQAAHVSRWMISKDGT